MTTTDLFTQAIQTAQVEYSSDTHYGYTNTENQKEISISFYQDEKGEKHIDDFCVNVKGLWVAILPTEEQVKLMYKMLDDTPYREVELEEEFIYPDHYFENGVRAVNFY